MVKLMSYLIDSTKKLINRINSEISYKAIAAAIMAIIAWYAGQIYAQYVDFNRQQTESRLKEYRVILDVASELVVEFYPPGREIPSHSELNKVLLTKLIKRFEVLYWGRSGLVVTKKVERDLKNLRIALCNAYEGFDPVPTKEGSRLFFQKKLTNLSNSLRNDYEKTTSLWTLFIHFIDDPFDSDRSPNNHRNSDK